MSCLAGMILAWWAAQRALFQPPMVAQGPAPVGGRANLTDRNGRLLATDVAVCRVALSGGVPLTIYARRDLLTAIPSLTVGTLDEIQRSGRRRTLAAALPFEACYRLRRLKLHGLSLYRDTRRAFPQGRAAAQLVGFTNTADAGAAGAELSLDAALKTARGPVRLALDLPTQRMAQQALTNAIMGYHARSGGLVVARAGSGEVLALTSLPDFDLNARAAAPPEATINRITERVYEFGAAFSPLALAAARAAAESGPRAQSFGDAYHSNLGRLGLLSAASLGLPGAARPLVPSRWRGAATAQTRRGYGIAVSAAALAQAYAALADRGRFVPLSILPSSGGAVEPQQAIPATVADAALAQLRASGNRVPEMAGGSIGIACGRTPALSHGRYRRARWLTTLVAVVPASLEGRAGTDVVVLFAEGARRKGCKPALAASRDLFAMLRTKL